jgi:hypothetical protein
VSLLIDQYITAGSPASSIESAIESTWVNWGETGANLGEVRAWHRGTLACFVRLRRAGNQLSIT